MTLTTDFMIGGNQIVVDLEGSGMMELNLVETKILEEINDLEEIGTLEVEEDMDEIVISEEVEDLEEVLEMTDLIDPSLELGGVSGAIGSLT